MTDSSRAVVSYWWKDVHYVLVNRLDLSLSRKSVVRLTDHLDMTIFVDWDVKPQIIQRIASATYLIWASSWENLHERSLYIRAV